TLAGDTPTEIITGTGVGETTTDRIPIAVFRRRATSTAYVWAIAINSDAPKIAIANITANGKPLDPSAAISVEVTSAEGTMGLIANPDSLPIESSWKGSATSTHSVLSVHK